MYYSLPIRVISIIIVLYFISVLQSQPLFFDATNLEAFGILNEDEAHHMPLSAFEKHSVPSVPNKFRLERNDPRESLVPGSISVIINTRNSAVYVTSMLESVEMSIMNLRERLNENNIELPITEVYTVDEGSKDTTMIKLKTFHEKKLKEKTNERKVNFYYVGLKPKSRIGTAGARNFLLSFLKGDIIFFLSNGFFSENQLYVCMSALIDKDELVDYAIVTGTDSSTKTGSISNLCVWQDVHHFVEGFPSQFVFTEDNPGVFRAYIDAMDNAGFIGKLVTSSSGYTKIVQDGYSVNQQYSQVQLEIQNLHTKHLVKKLHNIEKSIKSSLDPFWAIYYHSTKSNITDTNKDTRYTRYTKMFQMAKHQVNIGNPRGATLSFNLVHKILYNPKEP